MKLWKPFLAFVGVLTIAQVVGLNHFNSLLSGSDTQGTVTAPAKPAADVQAQIAALRKQYRFVAVSSDQSSAAYVDAQNNVHVVDLSGNTELMKTSESGVVQYIKWIRNDSLFIGLQTSPGTLVLKTLQPSSNSERTVHTFQGNSANAQFLDIAYSEFTNDVYILIGDNVSPSSVYHFDTNGNLSTVDLGGRVVQKLAVSQTGNDLYFEDFMHGTHNVLHLVNGRIETVQLNSALLGIVGNNPFYGTLDPTGLVTAVYKQSGGQSVLVTTLSAPKPANQLVVTSSGQIET